MAGSPSPSPVSDMPEVGSSSMAQKKENRRQDSLYRVQIGLTGLAGVILLVGLANIVIDKARMDERTMPPPVVATIPTDSNNAASEPLAELGVTPSTERSSQVVPDLQPDPALSKPMDHDPQ